LPTYSQDSISTPKNGTLYMTVLPSYEGTENLSKMSIPDSPRGRKWTKSDEGVMEGLFQVPNRITFLAKGVVENKGLPRLPRDLARLTRV